jgi:hypothetical protein
MGLANPRPPRRKFFGELVNFCLLQASHAVFSVFNSLLNLLKVTEDGTDAHLVKSKDVLAVNQHE